MVLAQCDDRPGGIPKTQLNLYAEQDLPVIAEGFSVNGRLIYTSSQFLDSSNSRHIPSWTRVDLGLRYVLPGPGSRTTTFRAGVDNVLGRDYWQSAAFSRLIPGVPRALRASLQVDF